MNRLGIGAVCVVMWLVFVAAGCATPEVAKEYEEPVLLPEEVTTALGSEDPTMRASAAEQIETLAADRRRAVLLKLSRDERPHVRLLVVGLLGKLHARDKVIQERLIDVLAFDMDADVRAAAVGALSRGGTARCLDALVETLSGDTSLAVRQAAAESLDTVTGLEHAPPVTGAVEEALDRADDAAMAYDEWVEENRDSLRWDQNAGRFTPAEAGGGR